MDNKNVRAPRQGLRNRPGWQLANLIKRAGYRQSDVAQRARTTQAEVSKTIYRITKGTPRVERIWTVLEEMLGQKNGSGT